MLHDKPEFQLIADARRGDRDAMGELFRRHYTTSISLARRILPLKDDWSDAVQCAYLSAFRHFNTYRGDSSFRTWLTRIVINQCLMQLRPQKRKYTIETLDDTGCGSIRMWLSSGPKTPEQLLLRKEVVTAFTRAAGRLPKPLRDVFSRCDVLGVPINETARALGISVAATKSRLFRARCRMRMELACFRSCLT